MECIETIRSCPYASFQPGVVLMNDGILENHICPLPL